MIGKLIRGCNPGGFIIVICSIYTINCLFALFFADVSLCFAYDIQRSADQNHRVVSGHLKRLVNGFCDRGLRRYVGAVLPCDLHGLFRRKGAGAVGCRGDKRNAALCDFGECSKRSLYQTTCPSP